MTPEHVLLMIDTIPCTHIYWCPVGGHWGVTVGGGRECWMGCNTPSMPWTIAHMPHEAQ